MKEQRRRLPKAISPLELLDDRIVPSAMGPAAMGPAAMHDAALAERSAIHATVHHRPIHAAVHHHAFRLTRLQRLANRGRIHLAAQLQSSGGPTAMNTAAVHAAPMYAAVANPTPVNAAPANLAAVAAQPVVSAPATPGPTSAMSTGGSGGRDAVVPASNTDATTTTTTAPLPNVNDVKNGPLAKAGQDLYTIYQEYEKQGGSSTFTSSLAGRVDIEGTNVGIDAHMASGNFTTFLSSLTSLGVQVRSQSAASGTVEGLIPIAQLPKAAQDPQTLSLSPIYIPAQAPRSLL